MEMESPDPVQQQALRRFGSEAVIERHDKLEAMIDDQAFLVGDHPTLADGVLIGVARWLEFHQVAERARWPRLAALRARIEADPAVRFALAIENGERPHGTGACLGHVALADVLKQLGS
jgi:glutathione S-transferase